MKIVLNRKYGSGFGLSPLGILKYCKLSNVAIYFYKKVHHKNRDGFDEWMKVQENEINNETDYFIFVSDFGQSFHELPDVEQFDDKQIDRTDPNLIETVDTLGWTSNASYSSLYVFDVPDDIGDYYIGNRDGIETVHKK